MPAQLPAKVATVFGRMGGQAQAMATKMQARIESLRKSNTSLVAKASSAGAKAATAGGVVAGGAIGGVIEGFAVPDVGPVKAEYLVGVPLVVIGAFVDGWVGSALVAVGAGVTAHAAGEDVSNLVADAVKKQRAETATEEAP